MRAHLFKVQIVYKSLAILQLHALLNANKNKFLAVLAHGWCLITS